MGNPVVVALAGTQKPLQRTVSTTSPLKKFLKVLPLERMATLSEDLHGDDRLELQGREVPNLSFTQQTLIQQFTKAVENPRYGDPRGYDFEWSRKGKTKNDTVHTLMALPPEQVADEITEAFDSFQCDLKAYCMGEPGDKVFGKSED